VRTDEMFATGSGRIRLGNDEQPPEPTSSPMQDTGRPRRSRDRRPSAPVRAAMPASLPKGK
jgi:hypothetical protein